MQAAIVIGAPPNIGYVSVARLPYEVDEFAVAGGITGEPVELVKCKTVDIEVPAHAEVVIEGEISTHESELEAPFGEATGYIGQREMMPYFTVKCITHRRNPVWLTFSVQLPPSEDHTLRAISHEAILYKQLRYDLNLQHVLAVAMHDVTTRICVIQMKKIETSEVWRTLESVSPGRQDPKIIIAVDEDTNPADFDQVVWSIVLRAQPHRDCRIPVITGPSTMDYSLEAPGGAQKRDAQFKGMPQASRLLIDATMKWPYPPVSLPKKQFMEEALQLWKQQGLPPLKLKEPWWGYDLGYWSQEHDNEASLATKGEYYKTGERLAQKRRPT